MDIGCSDVGEQKMMAGVGRGFETTAAVEEGFRHRSIEKQTDVVRGEPVEDKGIKCN